MNTENDVSDCRIYSGFEVSRRRKGKKRNGGNGNHMTMHIKNEMGDYCEGTRDANEEAKGIMSRGTSSDADGKLAVDAVVMNPPRITIVEPEEAGTSGSAIYPEENAAGSIETPTSPVSKATEKSDQVTTPVGGGSVNVIYNTRALSKYAATYELEKFEKNALIIFNQVNIDGYSKPRHGTEKDVEALTNTFEKFGFEVVEHRDCTKDKIFSELKTFTERDFTDYGCIGVAILSHGTNHGLVRAKDAKYSEIEVINHFKVHNRPTLVTKPKFLLIQACRGTKTPTGVPVFLSGKVQKDLEEEEEVEPYVLPVEADMLILHSSYSGNPSIRHEIHGSWFIQALCRKIDQLSYTQDLESIITEMKREVAIDRSHEEYNMRTYEMEINKQMPVLTSTLIRKLFLKKFGDTPTLSMSYASVVESSKNEVLDSGLSTPLLVQFGPCACFLDHFDYIRDCLRYYVEQNCGDETAQSFLDVASTFEDEEKHNSSKEKMAKAICKHLMKHAKQYDFFKFIYFYKH